MCSKESAPSVSSISRVLRGGGHTLVEGDIIDGRPSHSIDGILGRLSLYKAKFKYVNISNFNNKLEPNNIYAQNFKFDTNKKCEGGDC